ncbi:MAG: dependent protein [Frankiaceae bacterium]|nr:dependent protein [Frankiaceae bacterium]
MSSATEASSRRAELAANLAAVRARMVAAARAAGRDPAELTLVAVTKTFPASDVALLAGLGVADVGENRAQEAATKHAEVGSPPRWHFVGTLQRNKAALVASFADVIHSVDRVELVTALDRAAHGPLDVLLQVSLDGAPGRGGAPLADVPRLADAVAAADHLTLRGVMAVAPLGADPAAAFGRLAEAAARLRADHPGATWISAGMSGDLEAAVAAGATHVRIGTALLGRREPQVG